MAVNLKCGLVFNLKPLKHHACHPDFMMTDLPTTSRHRAVDCLDAAGAAGLTRVKLGNIHLLRD